MRLRAPRGATSYRSLARGLVRYATELGPFLRAPISLERAKAIVRRGMEMREAARLAVIDRAIFANPTSPYPGPGTPEVAGVAPLASPTPRP